VRVKDRRKQKTGKGGGEERKKESEQCGVVNERKQWVGVAGRRASGNQCKGGDRMEASAKMT